MQFDQNDVELLALCVWREASGEGSVGMDAVAHVIVNRVGFPGFAHNLHDVILGKNQFTSMSVPTDPQYTKHPGPNDQQYIYILEVAPEILDGSDKDVTLKAHYYANLATATSGWFFEHIVKDPVNHPKTVSIGRHTFYY